MVRVCNLGLPLSCKQLAWNKGQVPKLDIWIVMVNQRAFMGQDTKCCEKDNPNSTPECYGLGVAKGLLPTTQGENICKERMRQSLREKQS